MNRRELIREYKKSIQPMGIVQVKNASTSYFLIHPSYFLRACIAAFVLLFVSSAFAEEQLGVAVFPGAKYDEARTKMFRKSLSVKGAAYRTDAPVAEVAAFYKKQGLLFLKIGSSSKEIARFKKVDADVDVVVQSPWQDAKTGAKMTDTLILIFKEEEKGKKPEKPDMPI